jgi:hypothetical protein
MTAKSAAAGPGVSGCDTEAPGDRAGRAGPSGNTPCPDSADLPAGGSPGHRAEAWSASRTDFQSSAYQGSLTDAAADFRCLRDGVTTS